MPIGFVGSSEQNVSNDASPLSGSFTLPSLTDGLLVVGVGTIDTVTHTHNTPTWAGVAMSLAASIVGETTTGVFQRLSLYYLIAPTIGLQTFSVNYADGSTNTANISYIVPSWYSGVLQDQATVLDQFTTGSGSTDPSLTINPAFTNTLVVGMYASEVDTVLTPNGETLIQDIDNGTRCMGMSYVIKATANQQIVDWTGADNQWIGLAASFREAAAAGGAAKQFMHYNKMRAAA